MPHQVHVFDLERISKEQFLIDLLIQSLIMQHVLLMVCILVPYQVHAVDLERLDEEQFLNDTIMDFYLR